VIAWPSGKAAGCSPAHPGSSPGAISSRWTLRLVSARRFCGILANACDGSSGAERRLPNPRVEGSIPSCRAGPGRTVNARKVRLDVYPNRVTGSRRKRDAYRLWGFESLGVHSGGDPPENRREVAQPVARRRREPEVCGFDPRLPYWRFRSSIWQSEPLVRAGL
jgi:hypothetical protein